MANNYCYTLEIINTMNIWKYDLSLLSEAIKGEFFERDRTLSGPWTGIEGMLSEGHLNQNDIEQSVLPPACSNLAAFKSVFCHQMRKVP